MKKHRILSILFTLVLTLAAFSGVFAADDNTEGKIVSELVEGDSMNNNNGIITFNYGTVTSNYGVVSENYNYIGNIEDDGSVGYNFGTVDTNKEKGTVKHNVGTVELNEGTVNISSGKVNQNDGIIEENQYIVTDVLIPAVIDINTGTVMYNSGAINDNRGEVTNNQDIGIIEKNNGNVTENEGIVKDNAGTVEYNYFGEVEMADGGTVINNSGIVENASLVENKADPHGSHLEYGDDTYLGIMYIKDISKTKNIKKSEDIVCALQQWNCTQDTEGFTVLDYKDVSKYTGKADKGKKFIGWLKFKSSDTFLPGEVINKKEVYVLIGQWEDMPANSKKVTLGVNMNENGSFTVRGGKTSNFIGVYIDKKLVDPENYTLGAQGADGLPIEFTAAFLESLTPGEHIVEIRFSDSYAAFRMNH